MAGVIAALTEIVAWISPASPARELFAAPFVPRASFRGPAPHVSRTPAAWTMIVAGDEDDWDKAWNSFSKSGNTASESQSPLEPLEPLPPADIPVNWDEAWMTGMRNGFQQTDGAAAADDAPAAYSPLDQQKEQIKKEIKKEAWSRPADWGDVDPDAYQDDLRIDGLVEVPEEKQGASLDEQLMFLVGQRAKLEAESKDEDSVQADTAEKENKAPLKILNSKPLGAALLSLVLSAYVYTARPAFAIAAPASLAAAVLALYSAFGLVKLIVRALTVARVGLA